MTDPFLARPGTRADYDFIYSSWIQSYRIAEAVKSADSSAYYRGQNDLITRILRTSEITALVSREDPETIVACLIASPPWIHYLYVKHSFRKMGLAKRLVGDPAKWKGYTQQTPVCKRMTLPEAWTYNPYRAWLEL